MNRFVLACVLLCVTSQLSSAVILRPKWYPYFRRENQAQSTSNPPASALSAREARGSHINNNIRDINNRDSDSINNIDDLELPTECPPGLSERECFHVLVSYMSRMITSQLRRRRALDLY